MDQQVSIVLKTGERYDIHLGAADLAAFDKVSGRVHVGQLFEEAGLETPNPVGKILLVDQILMVAQEQKAAAWAAPDAKIKRFLAAATQAMGRGSLTIDLGNYKL